MATAPLPVLWTPRSATPPPGLSCTQHPCQASQPLACRTNPALQARSKPLPGRVQGQGHTGGKRQRWALNSRTRTPHHHKHDLPMCLQLGLPSLKAALSSPNSTLTRSWKGAVPPEPSPLPGLSAGLFPAPSAVTPNHAAPRRTSKHAPHEPQAPGVSLAFPDCMSQCVFPPKAARPASQSAATPLLPLLRPKPCSCPGRRAFPQPALAFPRLHL